MSKIKVIAKREYLLGVKKWTFWLMTLGLPLLIVSIFALSLGLGVFIGNSVKDKEQERLSRIIGIYDPATVLDWESKNEDDPEVQVDEGLTKLLDQINLPDELRETLDKLATKVTYNRDLSYKIFTDREAGFQAIRDKDIRCLLELDPAFLENFKATLHLLDKEVSAPSMRMTGDDLRDAILSKQFDQDQISDIMRPLSQMEKDYLQEVEKKEDEKAGSDWDIDPSRFGLSIIFMMLMFLGIMTSVDRLLRGLVAEKTNRVIEVLLSSTTAEQLMAGKVIGLGLLGMTQLAVWVVLGLIPAGWVLLFIDVEITSLLILLVFFVLGYFLIAIMVLSLGSLGSNLHESNQYSAVVIIMSVAPMMVLPVIMADPSGMVARGFSLFPFTAPIVVMVRYAAGAMAFWEIALSFVILLITLLGMLKVCAKIFRVGILMTGKPASLAALWRALRQS